MQWEWSLIFQIFWSFLKIGPVTFGGGYAMVPLIEREVVTKRKWVKHEDVTDVFAIAESVPGAIAINSATFIGYRIAGVPGAIAAFFGVLLPTFMIVIGLSVLFLYFQDHPKLEAAFEGIRAAIVALIVYAGYKIGTTAVFDKTTLAIGALTVLTLLFLHIHPVLIILCGGLLGIMIIKIKEKLGMVIKLEKNEGIHSESVDFAEKKL
jgi:chromate transporter